MRLAASGLMRSQLSGKQSVVVSILSVLAMSCASLTPQADAGQQGARAAGGGGATIEQKRAGHSSAADSGSGSTECRGPGRYESGKEGSYRPCCAGLQEVSYGKPGYNADGKTCDHPPLRVYACVRGECGDGICETGEAPACGCVQDCPQAAWDQGVDSNQMDAGSALESKCPSATSPCDSANSFCTRAAIEPSVAACVERPLTPYYAVRCGQYDGVVSQGIDSATYFYYDDSGKLVATNDVGLSARGCVSYDPSFSLPASCEIVTPECSADAGSD